MAARSLHASRAIHSARNINHDVGGAAELLNAPLPDEKPMLPWELECHALFAILSSDGVIKTDMLRRSVESLPLHAHEQWSYYEKWSAAIASLLREAGHIEPGELETDLVADDGAPTTALGAPRFATGDRVIVRREEQRRTAWRAPHLRTPGYIFGVRGVVERYVGSFADPSLLAFGVPDAGEQHLYRVRFRQADLWPEQLPEQVSDTIDVEVYEPWLLPPGAAEEAGEAALGSPREHVEATLGGAVGAHTAGQDCAAAHEAHDACPDHDAPPTHHELAHEHAHEHEHEDGHSHLSRPEAEVAALEAEGAPRPAEAVHHALVCASPSFLNRPSP